MRRYLTIAAVAAVVLAGGGGVWADVVIETVTVGNPGNLGEWSGQSVFMYGNATGIGVDRVCGSVAYTYEIAKFEITVAQYTEFLNAVAADDTYGLYNTYMIGDTYPINIARSGAPGSYTYSVVDPDNWANRPVAYIAWSDAARFANWMHNGQPKGPQVATTTENGSYALNGATTNPQLRYIARNAGATWVLPSEDEWYKAAYHKNNGATGDYWDYPTEFDCNFWGSVPSNDVINPDPGNGANFWMPLDDDCIGWPYFRTVVGEFENTPSPYGTFDQGGNIWEWTDSWVNPANPGTKRVMRGGSYYNFTENGYCMHGAWRFSEFCMAQMANYGIRLAKVLNDCNGNGVVDQTDLASGTSHDHNYNGVPDECDIAGGASLDCNANGIPDEVEVGALPPFVYHWDDGVPETSFGMVDGGYMGWMNNFAIVGGRETIGTISLSYALDWVPLGTPLMVYVWSDPNNDGNPADAVVLASVPTTITDGVNVVDIPDIQVGPAGTSFFVGALMQLGAAWYPASFDYSTDHRTSWLVSNMTAAIDPNSLGAPENALGVMADYGYPGNWMVSASPVSAIAPLDCNLNAVPDDCDITGGFSQDLNDNGVPDECDPPGLAGDMNCDDVVDFADINPFVTYLLDFSGWQSSFPGCDALHGDINGDGTYPSFGDINGFVELLVGR